MNVGHHSGRALLLARAALVLLVIASPGCGRKPHARRHAEAEAPAPPPPTPDNTPIDVLRTPSGMVLKLDEATPVPGKEITPQISPTAAPAR
ncbi:MAG: hypothetical protein ABI682_12085 [Acidobacteriota bacterium]